MVTGGGKGLGRRFAEVLAGVGATIILSGRRLEKLQESAESVRHRGGVAHGVVVDRLTVRTRPESRVCQQINQVVN